MSRPAPPPAGSRGHPDAPPDSPSGPGRAGTPGDGSRRVRLRNSGRRVRLALSALLALAAWTAPPLVPEARAQTTEVWSATVTAAESEGTGYVAPAFPGNRPARYTVWAER